jgi:hypothetical protein
VIDFKASPFTSVRLSPYTLRKYGASGVDLPDLLNNGGFFTQDF